MARILVTGGCGYIGSHTIVELLEHGHEVISIDNHSRSNPLIFDGIHEITGKRVHNINVDLSKSDAVESISGSLTDIDGIIHFAAFKSVNESVAEPLMYYDNNLQSLINILRLASTNNISNFVFSSSCTVYGDTKELPVRETTPFGTITNPYGMTKLIGEQLIRDFAKTTTDFNSILLRYFNPVGAHPSALIGEIPVDIPNNLVPYITQTAAGVREQLTVFGDDYDTKDGSCVRDYIHVMDLARAHIRALEYLLEDRSQERCEVFNLGTGDGISVLEMVDTFQSVNKIDLNFKIGPRRDGDIAMIFADNNKAVEKLGWKVENNVEDMMRSAWAWEQKVRSNGWSGI